VRLTINTFDSLAPIGQSSGVLCISHPRIPSSSFHWPRSFTGLPSPGHRAYCVSIPSLTHFSSSFWDTDWSMSVHAATSQNCTVSPDRVLCLVRLGLKTSGQGPAAWLLFSIHLGFGTEPFSSPQCLLPIHTEHISPPTTSQDSPLWFHSTLIVEFINGIHQDYS